MATHLAMMTGLGSRGYIVSYAVAICGCLTKNVSVTDDMTMVTCRNCMRMLANKANSKLRGDALRRIKERG